MNEINDEIMRIADDACTYLENQIERLRTVVSCTEAESIMREVCDYEFPQINCCARFTPLIRCVKIGKENEEPSSITQMKRFSFPPTECVKKPGRMNIPEVPTFYAANDIKTSLLESEISEGDEFYAGIWAIDDNASMLSYPCIPYDKLFVLSARGDVNAMVMKNCIDRFPCIRKMTDLIGKVFSLPHIEKASAENMYIYYLSGAIAHSILNHPKVNENGIYQTDAIIYPSVKMFGSTYNLAIRPQYVEQHMKLLYVVKGKINEGRISFSFDYVGFNENDTIIWKQMYKEIKDLHVTKIEDRGGIHSPSANENIRYEGKNYTLSSFEDFACRNLNRPNSPLKLVKFQKDNDIDLTNPRWMQAWETDQDEYLLLSLEDETKIQVLATIKSFFSAEGVNVEKVFNASL